MPNIPQSLTDAIEEIEAHVLSSDTLADPKARDTLRSHVDRWLSALVAYEDLAREENDDMGRRQPINHKQNPIHKMCARMDGDTNTVSKRAC